MIYIVLSKHFIKRLTKKVDKTPKSQVKFLLSLVEPITKQIEVENAENQRLLSTFFFSQKYMPIHLLDRHLPVELSDMIYKLLHQSVMRDICEIIKHKIVFVIAGNKMSFLICEHQNYYYLLNNQIVLNNI